jgi:hypothetical protein
MEKKQLKKKLTKKILIVTTSNAVSSVNISRALPCSTKTTAARKSAIVKTAQKHMRRHGLDYALSFGKYKRWTLRQVIWEDSRYVRWMIDEGLVFLDDEAKQYLELQSEKKQPLTKEDDMYDHFLRRLDRGD